MPFRSLQGNVNTSRADVDIFLKYLIMLRETSVLSKGVQSTSIWQMVKICFSFLAKIHIFL